MPTVLVVDDDALVRSFVRAALERVASVIEASDSDHAVHVLEQHGGRSLDLLIVDHVIQKLSGLDLLRLARLRWPWIPVVIMTGFGSEELAIEAFRAGACDYLRKPVHLDRLLETVAALTRARPTGTAGAHDLVADGPGTRIGSARAIHTGVCRALTFAGEHFTERITLSEAARVAALSRFHFCRLFHRETGFPFREYLHGLRVDRARALLADPRLTVTEVAYAVGFNDLSHFDKVFRRIAGLPPREYRKAILSN